MALQQSGPEVQTATRWTTRDGVALEVAVCSVWGTRIEAKLAAYALRDAGEDSVEANLALGLPVDDRDSSAAVDLLRSFGLGGVRLMTNNPSTVRTLEEGGIVVERESAWVSAPDRAAGYRCQKVHAMSHLR